MQSQPSDRTKRAMARLFNQLLDARDEVSAAQAKYDRTEAEVVEFAQLYGIDDAVFDFGPHGTARVCPRKDGGYSVKLEKKKAERDPPRGGA